MGSITWKYPLLVVYNVSDKSQIRRLKNVKVRNFVTSLNDDVMTLSHDDNYRLRYFHTAFNSRYCTEYRHRTSNETKHTTTQHPERTKSLPHIFSSSSLKACFLFDRRRPPRASNIGALRFERRGGIMNSMDCSTVYLCYCANGLSFVRGAISK